MQQPQHTSHSCLWEGSWGKVGQQQPAALILMPIICSRVCVCSVDVIFNDVVFKAFSSLQCFRPSPSQELHWAQF